MPKRWIGRWIMGVAVIHCSLGIVFFRATWSALFQEGLFNTVNSQAEREFPFWFLAFGLLAMLFGALIDWMEGQSIALPRLVGWGLLALLAPMLVIMPVSGGWLLLPAIIGAMRRTHPTT